MTNLVPMNTNKSRNFLELEREQDFKAENAMNVHRAKLLKKQRRKDLWTRALPVVIK